MSSIFDSLGMDPGIIIILLLILTIVLAVNVFSSKMRISRLERKYKVFMKGSDAQSLEKVFVRKFAQIDRLYEAKEDHEHDINLIKHHLETMFSKYGVEKYDAFDDVGGKLSFALALLDKNNTGLILKAVHSRDNCVLYLKEIVKGESYVVLSQEEVEALRKAVNFGLGEIEKE
mgnify:FL=1